MSDLLDLESSDDIQQIAELQQLCDDIVSTTEEGRLIELIRQLRSILKQLQATLPPDATLERNGVKNKVIKTITKDETLHVYLMGFLQNSNNQALRFEIAYFLSEVLLNSDYVFGLPTRLFDFAADAIRFTDDTDCSQAIDLLLEITKEVKGSTVHLVKVSYLVEKPIVSDLLNRVSGATDPLAAKACQLIARLTGIRQRNFFDKTQLALPFILSCFNSNSNAVIAGAAEALAAFTDAPDTQIEIVINAANRSVLARLVELLLTPVEDILHPVLRTVGNIITGSDNQTQMMIDLGVVPNLLWLLDYPNKKISREACWTISNISAGSSFQIQEVINAAIIPKILILLKTAKDDEDLQNDAAWTIANLLSGGTTDQVDYVISEGGIETICDAWEGLYSKSSSVKVRLPLKDCFKSLLCLLCVAKTRDSERIREKLKSKILVGDSSRVGLWPEDVVSYVKA